MKGNNQKPEAQEPAPATGDHSGEGQGASVVATAPGAGSGDDAVQESASELRAKVEKLEDGLLRARADLQNAQRRATTERLDAVRYANAELIKPLLAVVDDLERALSTADKPSGANAFVEGVRLVHQNLVKALADHGLETIDALGKPFDPTLHDALMQQPSSDKAPGTVIEQVTKGYRLRGRVLRPARVVVAKAPEGTVELELGNGISE